MAFQALTADSASEAGGKSSACTALESAAAALEGLHLEDYAEQQPGSSVERPGRVSSSQLGRIGEKPIVLMLILFTTPKFIVERAQVPPFSLP